MPPDTVPERWSEASRLTDVWLDPEADPREADSIAAVDERSTLLDYLRRYRLTLELKCAGLTPAQLATRSVPPSTMSLLGLVRHLAQVEQFWFRIVLAGQDVPRRYREHGRNADFDDAVGEPAVVAEAWQAWRAEVDFAQQFLESVSDLSQPGTMPDGSQVQTRDILVHLIEEYARHCGHADLLRERIDGRTGQ